MPSSIDVLVADRLDISNEQARTLLRTMVKELRDRAREEGVRLPELGTFQEEHRALRFSPSPSLRRLVNRQYEGLQTEDLSTAAGYDQEEDESIPTLLDQAEDRSRSAPSSEPEPAPGAQPEPAPGDQQDYPILEEEDEEFRDDESAAGPQPIRDMDEPEREPVTPDESHAEHSSASSPEGEPEDEPEFDQTSGFRPPDSFQFIAALLLVVLLVGIGWFVLDQTNVLPSLGGGDAPQMTAQQNAQTAPPAASQPDTAGAASASESRSNRYPGVDPSETSERTSEGRAVQTSAGTASARSINPDAGGWTIVVASTAERGSASPLVAQYKNRFADTSLPVDIVVGTVNDRVRYRVALGHYDSRQSALRAIEKYESMLPEGAWPLQLG